MKRTSPKFGNNFIYGYNIDEETSGVATLRDEEDLKNICIGKKELQDFKDDKSLTVDYGFDDDHTISNEQNVIFKEKIPKDITKEKDIIMTSIHSQQVEPQMTSEIHKKTKTNVLWKFIGGDNSFEEEEIHRKKRTNELSNYLSNDPFFNFKDNNYNKVTNTNLNTINTINNIHDVFPQHTLNRNANTISNTILTNDKYNNRRYHHQRKETEGEDYPDFDDNFKEDEYEYDSQSPIDVHNSNNNNNNNNRAYGITHNELVITGKPVLTSSVVSYGSFGISRSQQLEKEYKEMKQHYEAVLGLLQYWQEFYKDILNIVEAKKILQMEDADEESLTSEEFKQTVVKLVKDLVLQAKKRVYHIFDITKESNFIIWSLNKNTINIQPHQIISKVNDIHIKSFSKEQIALFKENNINLYIKGIKRDIENDFPPILFDSYVHKQKYGMTTTYVKPKINHNHIVHKEVIFECIRNIHKENVNIGIQTQYENKNKNYIKDNKPSVFPTNKTQFDKAVSTFIGNKLSIIKPRTPIINSSNHNNTNNNSNNIYNNSYKKKRGSPSPLKTRTPSKPNQLSLTITCPLLFQIIHLKKRKTTRESQTDLNIKHLDSIELMNKEYSTQLAITQKDKEKMQKLYEDKIHSLNIKIEEQQKTETTPITTQSNDDISQLRQSNTNLFLPELIPPEQTYKIFIHCVKHFKYEETLYRKFMEEADIQYLKTFISKMEKAEQNHYNRNKTTKNYVSKYLKLKQPK